MRLPSPLWSKSPLLLLRYPALLGALAGGFFLLALAIASNPFFVSAAGSSALVTKIDDATEFGAGATLSTTAALFETRGPEDDPDLLAGYREAAGLPAASFDDAARVRLALYRAYLYLIMLAENHPRASSPEQHAWTRTHAGPALVSALDTIEDLTGTKARQRERPGRGSHDQ